MQCQSPTLLLLKLPVKNSNRKKRNKNKRTYQIKMKVIELKNLKKNVSFRENRHSGIARNRFRN